MIDMSSGYIALQCEGQVRSFVQRIVEDSELLYLMLLELSRRWHAGHRGPALDPGRLPHYWGQRNLGVMPQAPIRSFPLVRTPHATIRQIEFEASITSP